MLNFKIYTLLYSGPGHSKLAAFYKVKMATLVCELTRKLVITSLPIIISLTSTILPQVIFNVAPSFICCAQPSTNLSILSSVTGLVEKIFVFLINYIFWTLIHLMGYLNLVDLLIGPMCLTICHLNNHKRLEYWLQICHFNCDNHSVSSKVDYFSLSRLANGLMTVQLLMENFNGALRIFYAFTLVVTGTCEVVSLSILLGPLKSQVPPPLWLFFIGVAAESILTILVFYDFAANLHYVTTRSFSILQSKEKVIKSRYLKRFLKSCQVLRVQIGSSNNYLEKRTPLVFQKFCIDRIIDLLLLSKK